MKKKHSRLIQIILVAIVFITLFFVKKSDNLNNSLPQFAICDTNIITSFTISNGQNNISLQKTDKLWLINNKLPANTALVNLALQTIAQITIKEPVAKSERKKIGDNLNIESTQINFYNNKKLLKSLFIGKPTPDSLGTYAKINRNGVPFIVEIPGFNGYLTTRYPSNLDAWSTKAIFQFSAPNIKSLIFENNIQQNESFKIVANNKQTQLYNYQNKKTKNVDNIKAKSFLSRITYAKYETIHNNKKQISDSLNKIQPIYYIQVELHNGDKQILKVFRKKLVNKSNFFGENVAFDPNIFYALKNDNHLIILSYKQLSNITTKHSDLLN